MATDLSSHISVILEHGVPSAVRLNETVAIAARPDASITSGV